MASRKSLYICGAVVVAMMIASAAIGLYAFLSRVDHGDPQAVAAAFLGELREGDPKAASKYVFPPEREQFLRSFQPSRLPAIPNHPQLSLRYKSAGNTRWAEAKVAGVQGLDLFLRQADGWWYVTR